MNRESILDGIPEQIPALYGAYQTSSKAARVGFDWENLEGIRDQFLEEFEELQAAIQEKDEAKIKEEVGDLLLTAINISRQLQIDPETALTRANPQVHDAFQGYGESTLPARDAPCGRSRLMKWRPFGKLTSTMGPS